MLILSTIQVTRAKGGARAPKAPPLATLLKVEIYRQTVVPGMYVTSLNVVEVTPV